MKKKYLYGIFSFVAVCVFLLFLTSEEKSELSNSILPSNGLEYSENKMVSNNSNKKINASSSSVKQWFPMGDSATAEKIKAWFAARGNYSFYGPDAYREYQNYDMATLTKLGDDGDVRAMHVLADRSETLQERKSILYKAAIYGSTEALARIAGIQDTEHYDSEKTYEEKISALFEVLAYQEVAEIRGDWWPNIQMKNHYLKQYDIELTAQDNEAITKLAREIYERLQKERNVLGLGDFDNTVPDEVLSFYEEMLRPL